MFIVRGLLSGWLLSGGPFVGGFWPVTENKSYSGRIFVLYITKHHHKITSFHKYIICNINILYIICKYILSIYIHTMFHAYYVCIFYVYKKNTYTRSMKLYTSYSSDFVRDSLELCKFIIHTEYLDEIWNHYLHIYPQSFFILSKYTWFYSSILLNDQLVWYSGINV